MTKSQECATIRVFQEEQRFERMVDTMEKMTNVKALDFVLTACADKLTPEVAEKLTTMKAQFEKKNSAERKPTAT
ncbi:MAG: hypothetical protein Q4A15_09965, partial [Prevotellaceae bacterium]|nr:hypothetical protein [Prevotellaceae bacterium]